MNVGLYGGTFDPIHNGHLLLAEWTREVLNLDKIIFIPAFKPPHKREQFISDVQYRLQMLRLAIKNNPYFEISMLEIEKSNISYSIETILLFKKKYNLTSQQLFFMIGADSLYDFPNWYHPDEICKNCTIVVYQRLGFNFNEIKNQYVKKTTLIKTPIIQISSTKIRQHVSSGKSIKYMVPVQVEAFICKNSLYKST